MTTRCLPLRLLDCLGLVDPSGSIPDFGAAPMATEVGLAEASGLVGGDLAGPGRGGELRTDEVTIPVSMGSRST